MLSGGIVKMSEKPLFCLRALLWQCCKGKEIELLHNYLSSLQFSDRTNPIDKHLEIMINKYGLASAPVAPQMFASAGKEHMEKYGM